MPLRFNTNKLSHTPEWKYFKIFLMPVNSAVAFINTFLLYFYPGLATAIPQTRVYLQTISAASIRGSNKMNQLLLRTARMNHINMLLFVLLSVCVISCQSRTSAGIKKDLGTGLQTEYKNIEPEEAMLVMNDEVLNHNDIPLGEQFAIVNKSVKGFTEKDGKISLGCSLLITDMKGNVILKEPDLFKDTGTIDAEKTAYLKCTVSTGKPMEWEEKYNVKTGFWDKWGDGTITNEVTIRMIDMP